MAQVEFVPAVDANKGLRPCPLADPDNNMIQLVGNFRVKY